MYEFFFFFKLRPLLILSRTNCSVQLSVQRFRKIAVIEQIPTRENISVCLRIGMCPLYRDNSVITVVFFFIRRDFNETFLLNWFCRTVWNLERILKSKLSTRGYGGIYSRIVKYHIIIKFV